MAGIYIAIKMGREDMSVGINVAKKLLVGSQDLGLHGRSF
jgi:hypothetical protein